jgi:hypothetical protein
MKDEREELIAKLVQEGKKKEEIRNELISQGLSTEGFQTQYEALAKESPLPQAPAPIKKKPEPPQSDGSILGDYESFDLEKKSTASNSQFISSLKKLVVLSLFCVLLFIVWTQNPDIFDYRNWSSQQSTSTGEETTVEQNLSVNDKLIQGKVESTVVSAGLFVNRMGGFDGVCNDISVVEPVRCQMTKNSFVIFAPVSIGGYYCVDSKQQRGVVETIRAGSEKCF